jgi:hypothetical protein
MKLIEGMGTGISLDAEAFASGILNLSEENKALLQKQMEEFLNAI